MNYFIYLTSKARLLERFRVALEKLSHVAQIQVRGNKTLNLSIDFKSFKANNKV